MEREGGGRGWEGEEGGWGHTLRRRSLAVWMSSSLGFSLKVPWAHSSATCSGWQPPRGQAGRHGQPRGPSPVPTLTLITDCPWIGAESWQCSPEGGLCSPHPREHLRPHAPLPLSHGAVGHSG